MENDGAMNLRAILETWDFSDLDTSASRFDDARSDALSRGDGNFAAELTTQLARVSGLQRDFDRANEQLDAIEHDLPDRSAVVHVRYLLERGRVLNTSGDAQASMPLFRDAWDRARRCGAHYLAVDAAHMLGIVAPVDERLAWNQTAIEYAESCGDEDARRWLGSLYNNTAWTLHDAGDAEGALELFERALAVREGEGAVERTLIARWSVARCLRTLGRDDEALAMQRHLVAARGTAGLDPGGFVHEEIGELLLLAGEDEAARDQFKIALPLLREITWLSESDPGRLDRIEALALEE